ncbi:histidine kinase [Cellvibrio zantedeschiae]|uniref:Histidine kinase n=1 Tax=Cellvibrio zantedeschiae TaxID=1237077 RepID=A0ABQ3ARP2_9GAMM|nr:CBS domain-containing protein [Cellvibrio zantedeschiae]GGY61933.1 histidine kinase [Cellvibrio zantedeschiae]
MKKVKDILSEKINAETHSIAPSATVWDAIKLMTDKSVGALLVTENDKLVGIISERDYMRKVALMGRASQTTDVRDIMTPNPLTVAPDQTTEVCMELMTEKRIRHLPVVENGKILAMLSIRDLLENIMEEQKHLILQLEQYIRGETY